MDATNACAIEDAKEDALPDVALLGSDGLCAGTQSSDGGVRINSGAQLISELGEANPFREVCGQVRLYSPIVEEAEAAPLWQDCPLDGLVVSRDVLEVQLSCSQATSDTLLDLLVRQIEDRRIARVELAVDATDDPMTDRHREP